MAMPVSGARDRSRSDAAATVTGETVAIGADAAAAIVTATGIVARAAKAAEVVATATVMRQLRRAQRLPASARRAGSCGKPGANFLRVPYCLAIKNRR